MQAKPEAVPALVSIEDSALSDRAKPYLAQFLAYVAGNGTLTARTLPQFVEMVELHALEIEARATAQREGEFTTTYSKSGRKRIRAHPALRVVSRCSWRLMRLSDIFLMNPTARRKAALRRVR